MIQRGNSWQLEIYEPEAQIIRMIYDWYVNGDQTGKGMTLQGIAQRLTDARVPTPHDLKTMEGIRRGRKKRALYEWSGSTIAHYLDREVYMGVWIYGRKSSEPIRVSVPAIVSEELWETAKRIRKQKFVENIKTRKKNPLWAVLFCCDWDTCQ